MKKYYCDICRVEVQWGDLHKLTIESQIFISAYGPMETGPKIKTQIEKELCPEHARKINDYIEELEKIHE